MSAARWPAAALRRLWRSGWAGAAAQHRAAGLASALRGRTLVAPPLLLPPQQCAQRHGLPALLVRGMAGAAAGGSSKTRTVYRCSECGEESLQWTGSCRSCKAFNT